MTRSGTNTSEDERGAGFQKDHGETVKPKRACDEEKRRTQIEESAEDGYTREKKDRMTEKKRER